MNQLISEEIQRMILLSKYDNSKTLSEQADPWSKYPCVVNHPNAVKGTDSSGGVNYTINGVIYYGNGRKKLADSTMAGYTCNDAEFVSNTKTPAKPAAKPAAKPVATPPELKDIKSFQDWLDVNAKGWATGYKDGIINKGQNGGGYGKYGPRTQKAWATYKDQFLKGGNTATQTPPEIEGEDNTQTVDPNNGEFGGGTTTEQPAKVETPPTNDQAVTLQGNPQSVITPGKLEPASGAVYGQQYKSSDGKTYVWNGTEYQVKA